MQAIVNEVLYLVHLFFQVVVGFSLSILWFPIVTVATITIGILAMSFIFPLDLKDLNLSFLEIISIKDYAIVMALVIS